MYLQSSVADLPIKILPNTLKQLKTLGILTVEDLLRYYPKRYLDFSKFTEIKNISEGEVVTVKVKILSIGSRFVWTTKKSMAEATVQDQTGKFKVVWFNQGWIAKALQVGDEVFLSGKAENYKGLKLVNPIQEKVTSQHLHTGRLVPIYKLPDALYDRTFRTLVNTALPYAKDLKDIIPTFIRQRYHLLSLMEATQELHFPTSIEAVNKAHERLAFEEALIQQLAVLLYKNKRMKYSAPNIHPDIEQIKTVTENLPFTLTLGQKQAIWDICKDLESKHPMNRLLMGDVGSGKTIVALISAMQVIKQGFQVALLAPTEVLAKQHHDRVTAAISNFQFPISNIGLLTRSFQLSNASDTGKAELIKKIGNESVQLIIGTHALLQEKIKFKNLAFIIIDEQHRLGVNQRDALMKKMNEMDGKPGWFPHSLSMSATPIPRSLALSLYGDLDISIIDELPQNRLPIKTWKVPEGKRAGAYEFVKKELQKGRQAFIITPLVEAQTTDSERSRKMGEIKSAKAEFENLQKNIFQDFKLGLVYGTMKGKDKDETMWKFKNREIDILVATSVVEVGVDIPNASVIIIEGAERFGLAQLHQLRGRIGRGKHQSYCLLFTSEKNKPGEEIPLLANDTEKSKSHERLDFFAQNSSGFRLAEYDLKTRGFGSLFGTDQTGFSFKYGQYLTMKIFSVAKEAGQKILEKNPDLSEYQDLKNLALPLSENLHLE